MANVNSLSEEFIEILREMAENYRRGRPVNAPSKSRSHRENSDAPEMYIAKPVDAGGIPSMEQAGTSLSESPAAGDVAGSALCDIFKLSSNGTFQEIGLQKTVYNLSQDPIGYEWIIIQRDKFGSWIAQPKVRNLMATPRVTYKAGEDAEFQIMSGNSSGGQFEKGLEPPISEWVRAYVRKGIVAVNRPYQLSPVSPCGNPGTSPTQATVYDVVDPTTHFYAVSVRYAAMGATIDVLVGGVKLVPVVALFGEINHGVDVWVAWDEINVRFVGIQVACPTGTGT